MVRSSADQRTIPFVCKQVPGLCGGERQRHSEGSTLAGTRRLGGDGAAMRFHDLPRNVEAEAHASRVVPQVAQPAEPLKNSFALRRVEAGASVADLKPGDTFARQCPYFHD